MIGLESNKICIDIHESKVPLRMRPKYVEIYHDGKLLHKDRISLNAITGVVNIDVEAIKEKFDEIFNSAGRYLPFTFKFLTHLRQLKISYSKG